MAVRALCEFTAKQGDLDRRFTPSATALEGIKGQGIVAQRRGADYETELALEGRCGPLRVRGRADGYDPRRRCLEEIKTLRGHPDDIPAMQQASQDHLDGLTPRYAHEHRRRCRDGSWKWVLSRGIVIARDKAGGRSASTCPRADARGQFFPWGTPLDEGGCRVASQVPTATTLEPDARLAGGDDIALALIVGPDQFAVTRPESAASSTCANCM
mgnify:CR=1 FL=1